MNFFEQQDRARAVSRRLFILYGLALVGALLTLNVVTIGLVHLGETGKSSRRHDAEFDAPPARPMTLREEMPVLIGTGFFTTLAAAGIIGLATAIKLVQLGGDGARVAEMLGGRPITGQPTDLDERKFVNVVEEMSIASGVPMPRLYLLEAEQGINAFAAGTRSEAAVIGVTRGAISQLSRDELQGVIAHEFSHILNGDMRVNLRLIALNFGLIALGYLGLQTLRFTPSFTSSDSDDKGAGAAIAAFIMIVAIAMAVVGYIGTLFGKMLQAAVSRQREYLADASAVQFTRNPRGIGIALRKIGALDAGATLATANAGEASHLFFADGVAGWLDSVFATHPPIEARVRAIDPTLLSEPIQQLVAESPRSAPVMQSHASPPPLPMAAMAAFAANAAARARGERVAVTPTQLTDVGRAVSQSQVDAAAQFIQTLPASLLELAREPYGARGVAVGLLLDDNDPSTRDRQLQRVASVDEPLARLVAQHAEAFITMTPAARLPLFDRAMPSLRQLSPSQLADFRALCQALAEADATITPFETALLTILDNELGLSASSQSSADARGGPATIEAAAEPIGIVLSSLAIAGGVEQATNAFANGVMALQLSAGTVQASPRYDGAAFSAALSQLRRSPQAVRRRVIDAAASCVTADGTVGVAELELMRAVSAALNVSIPPLLTAPPS